MGLVIRLCGRHGRSNKLILEDESLIRLQNKLQELEDSNREIRVALAGAGLMGTGMVSQLNLVTGMRPALVVDRTLAKILRAFDLAKIAREDVLVADRLEEINRGLEEGKLVASTRLDLIARANIDVVVDATGNPMAGAEISMMAIENKKHIVLLNVETDAVIGPILNKKAREAGVVYTGTAGDEPGSCKEIFDFAKLCGFEILAMGKGKNNPIDYGANPDSVRKEAESKNLKPSMLAGFVDGTNTMIEMNVMANATGFRPDIPGGHGIESSLEELAGKFMLKSEGGILNKYGVVDYVNGIAPGVFVVVRARLPQVDSEMQFLKMGDGPNYILYRPYHLTSLETPITIARAFIDGQATIAPDQGQVCDTVALAKKDLEPGDYLDGIGNYTVYGRLEDYDQAREKNLVPISLISREARMIKPAKKGQPISYDMVELDEESLLYRLRKEQEDL